MTKPRILLVNKFYAPWIGGVESVVQTLAEGLASDFRTRVLCCTPENGSPSSPDGVAIDRVPSLATVWGMPIAPRFGFRLWRRARQSDLIHLHLPFPLADLSWLMASSHHAPLNNKPLVITFHAPIIRQKAVMLFYRPFLAAALDRAAAIIVTSPRLRENIPELKPFLKKTHVIPLGIDPQKFSADEPIRQKALAIRKKYGTPLLLTVGRLNYYKGVHVLLEAMRKVNARLLIIGDGSRRPQLEKQLEQNPARKRIHLLGERPAGQLAPYFAACDFFVLPSIFPSEAFGIVQLEAMATGKAIINTNLASGVPWVARHLKEALTVAPNDAAALAKAINHLLAEAGLRAKLGAAGQKRLLKKFTRRAMLTAHQQLYAALLSQKRLLR